MSALRPFPSAGRFSIVITWNVKRAKMATPRDCLRAQRASRSSSSALCRSCGRTFQHFAREGEVRFGPARFHVVEEDRHPMARRLAEAHVARDDGAKNFFLEELTHVGGDLLTEIRPLVEHRQED